ncbi:MAG: nucleoside triphosphate pyrophosphohydrolase [bacterium]|nr:nucleoside triphosphate pyrophosphohydrolase [bacterium]MDZ4345344.1 nucleoside triphosphate pyrophosphohydrolase [Candidatus Binatia bacterium]
MPVKKYNKLVRDKIPDIIKKHGSTPIIHTAKRKEYSDKLLTKLREEVNEFITSPSPEELVDILEVIDAIITLNKFNRKTITRIKRQKAQQRGRFKKRIILDQVKE